MVCSYCGAVAEGYREDLEMIGWTTAEVRAKGQISKKIACPSHRGLIGK